MPVLSPTAGKTIVIVRQTTNNRDTIDRTTSAMIGRIVTITVRVKVQETTTVIAISSNRITTITIIKEIITPLRSEIATKAMTIDVKVLRNVMRSNTISVSIAMATVRIIIREGIESICA